MQGTHEIQRSQAYFRKIYTISEIKMAAISPFCTGIQPKSIGIFLYPKVTYMQNFINRIQGIQEIERSQASGRTDARTDARTETG